MAIGTLAVLDFSLAGGLFPGGGSLDYARTMAFTTLVFFQLFNVFNARSDERSAFVKPFSNKWLWVAILVSTAMQVLVVNVPFLQQAFSTVSLSPGDWLVCLAVASTVLWAREIFKLVNRMVRK
jgi:Ca2+-transporting ATPase